MKSSEVIFKLDMGIVMDETRMSAQDVLDLLTCMDLNSVPATPVGHILRDIDSGRVVLLQDLETGLNVVERHSAPL